MFIDSSRSKQMVMISDCEPLNPPCPDAIVLHRENHCPNCDILWYECPSETGRIYTILPTPCGVTITSFEDGLLSIKECNAAAFGSQHFCFGKIYSSVGTFDSTDKSSVTFSFDKHIFTVKGNLGLCFDDLFLCDNCSSSTIEVFADLPTPPEDIAAPPVFGEEPDEDEPSEDDTPSTEVIPSEGRTEWTWDVSVSEFGIDTTCEAERAITGWTGGTALTTCSSNDNPSITTLPSGHTIAVYENRREDGITKISLAVLSSSVHKDVRYFRSLSRGTLLNNLAETEGVGHFEIFDELAIAVNSEGVPSTSTQLGFLTGPLAGQIRAVTKVTRTVNGARIKNVLNFDPNQVVEFSDKNHIYNVKWFLLDDLGSGDLPPPNADNIITVLDIPNHTDAAGNEVPVANPSIAVAQNNLMTVSEQNVYVVYQAFESNQWRVYLREILLGGDGEIAPTYEAPYLFDEAVRQIEIMRESGEIAAMQAGYVFYDESFSQSGIFENQKIDVLNEWASIPAANQQEWAFLDLDEINTYPTDTFTLCDEHPLFPVCETGTGNTCMAVFNAPTAAEIGENSAGVRNHLRSFVVNNTRTKIPGEGNALNLTYTLSFNVLLNDFPFPYNNIREYPEIWFLVGLDNWGENTIFGQEGFRIQIRRGYRSPDDSMSDILNEQTHFICTGLEGVVSACGLSECFIISLYGQQYPKPGDTDGWWDRDVSDGSQRDKPIRVLWHCLSETGGLGDYKADEWNDLRLETYVKGAYRYFDVFLSNSLGEVQLASFREWDETTFTIRSFGFYHGFGVVLTQADSKHQVAVSNFRVEQRKNQVEDTGQYFFLEDYFNRDESGANTPGDIPNIVRWNPFIEQSDTAPSTPILYDYGPLQLCTDRNGDNYYPVKPVWPGFTETSAYLYYCRRGAWPPEGYWTVFSLKIPTRNLGLDHDEETRDEYLNVSITLSVNRDWTIDNGAWPQIWFNMRMPTYTSPWYGSWRLRIFRFTAQSNYPTLGPGINQDDDVWWLQLYDGDGDTGTSSDNPVAEQFIVNSDIDWTEWNPQGTDEDEHFNTVWNYFKVDIEESESNTVFTVWVGDDSEGQDTVEENFQQLTVFDVPSISSNTGLYYGFALFSGLKEEPELNNDDYRSSAVVNYVKLSTIAEPQPVAGACCRAVGDCNNDVLIENCQDPDEFHPDVPCSEVDCTVSFPTGAACREDGDCKDNITLAEATLQGYGICAGCEWQEGVDCFTRNCPVPTETGSCCRPINVCVPDLTFEECSVFFGGSVPGQRYRVDTDCPPSGPPCPDTEEGSCCLAQGCIITTASLCAGQGGTFQGANTDCTSNPCLGACCNGASCSQTDQPTCEDSGFTFLGYDIACTGPNPCIAPDPVQACCFADNSCLEILESACLAGGGTWFYDSLCSENPCAEEPTPTGACCNPNTGACEDDVTETDCNESGRNYQLDGSTCALVTCPQPTGACCINSVCSENLTQLECENTSGTYLGNFSNCIPDICVPGVETPYIATSIIYKPEDLWRIEIADEQYITRVLYHMREEILVSSVRLDGDDNADENTIDFMFVIDHSATMETEIELVQQAVPDLAADLISKGFDVRFGFVIFGRSQSATPVPIDRVACGGDNYIFNGLQATTTCNAGPDNLEGSAENGFTRSISYLQRALDCWYVRLGRTAPWAAINFALDDPQFAWRENASKFIFFITDTNDEIGLDETCGTYSNIKQTAKDSLINNNVVFIPAIDPSHSAVYQDVVTDTGWTGATFDVNSTDYGEIFEAVVIGIDSIIRIDHASIMERSSSGTDASFLKKAEVIISYNGDLSDLWSFDKADFQFQDDHVPFPGTTEKGLTNFPFALSTGKTYGIDPVHIQGLPENWVSFGAEGSLNYSYPDVGQRASSTGEFPLLISTNSTRPKVFVNNRNQVIVAYESYTSGTSQIEIKGTGDFHQDSITGPKATRIQRFLTPNDFAYSHAITLPGEGLNQICDFIVDNSDITHIVWQSNRSGIWEIYYANSFNLFQPVRITKSDSRSSHPSISVDEAGSIFVVYHDDRFGPFNIFLASKDEERVIPLLEQDAYLASLYNQYTHYTNILPLFLDNPAGASPKLGQFWATKLAVDAGNDEENVIYKLDETDGTPSEGVDTETFDHKYIAFTSAALYSINAGGALYKVGTIADDKSVTFSSTPTNLGTINLDIDGFKDYAVLDMTADRFDRLWVLIYEEEESDDPTFATIPSGLPLVSAFGVRDRLRLEQVSAVNAATLSSGIVFDGQVDADTSGSITVTSDNKFYITFESGDNQFAESEYPVITEGEATFDFQIIGTTSINNIISIASDVTDTVYAVTEDNDLYTVNRFTAGTTFQTSLTTSSGAEVALPVGTTSGMAFQDLEVETTGGSEFFHVRVDFYDNISFEGSPFLVIDSRDNLEAFINDQVLADPYLDPYGTVRGMDARGILLAPDQVGIVFFDATHYVPGFSRLSQPFTFEPNQTYFPRVFLINASGSPRESGIAQSNSFSCSKCSRFGNNNFNTSACAYSFVAQNNANTLQFYNFQIDFYADAGKQHLIRRFEATPGSDDLQYMEVDNRPATEIWTDIGVPIDGGDALFIQIHPVLDPQAGFLCGVQYTVQVNQCFDATEQCSDFSIITSDNWFSILIGEITQTVDTVLEDDEITLGLSMSLIGDNIGIAWRSDDDNLKYSVFDGERWLTQTVLSTEDVKYCDLHEVQGQPAIAYIRRDGDFNVENVLMFDGGSWNPVGGAMGFRYRGTQPAPKSLIEFENAPFTTFTGVGTLGQVNWAKPSYSSTFDTDSACPNGEPGDQGSCTTTCVLINGIPAVAYKAGRNLKYSAWATSSFSTPEVVTNDPIVGGVVGLAEINTQPAIAYIKQEGSKGRLIYLRFNGSTWQKTVITGARDFNKHLAMASVNGQPAIVYSLKKDSTTSELRYASYNGSIFIDEVIDEEIEVIDPLVDIVEFQNQAAVAVSANAFRLYMFRQQPTSSVTEIRPVFFCECSSKIFTNRLTHLNEVARWESSGHGFADTRVTNSVEDSTRPVMKTRLTGAAIIIWEDNNVTENCSSPPCIRAATFRHANQDQLRASGTQFWFDYDFGISGQDPAVTLDLYDRVSTIYEKSRPVDSVTSLPGKGLSTDELPGNELFTKVCDFALDAGTPETGGETQEGCDISSLEANAISFDEFISSQIIRKIRVKDKFVEYYTYNASGVLTPIVSACNIKLEVHGVPEIVALRLKNENSGVFGPWCAWSPQLADFVMEKEHKLSPVSGIKEICIQAITYSGITTEFCLPIVADYGTIVFETRFYRRIDNNGNEIDNFDTVDQSGNFAGLDNRLVLLPLSEGIAVTNLAPTSAEILPETARILVEIVPDKDLVEESVTFDVVQQGNNDIFGRTAQRGKNNDGRVVYRGEFTIEREDNVFNIDGLARVSPTFPSSCEDQGTGSEIGISDTFTRDRFNIMGENVTVEATELVDSLADFRQITSGRVGVDIDIRTTEDDPYFVFGDPNYSVKRTDGKRAGVPFEVAQTEISVGEAPEQEVPFCPPPNPNDENLGCPEGTEWEGWPTCSCVVLEG
jgi:hypothetical protein